LRAEVRGIPVANDLESVQCVHFCVEGTRSHSTVQSHCEIGRVPGIAVLRVLLAMWRYRPDRRTVTPSSSAPSEPLLNTSAFVDSNPNIPKRIHRSGHPG